MLLGFWFDLLDVYVSDIDMFMLFWSVFGSEIISTTRVHECVEYWCWTGKSTVEAFILEIRLYFDLFTKKKSKLVFIH